MYFLETVLTEISWLSSILLLRQIKNTQYGHVNGAVGTVSGDAQLFLSAAEKKGSLLSCVELTNQMLDRKLVKMLRKSRKKSTYV